MNRITQVLVQQRINDLHRTASRARVARQAKTRRTEQASTRRRGRRAQVTAVTT